MKQMSFEAFDRARHFLKTQARPLDRALFEYRFENASTQAVITALMTYQNDDGGFGRALEPDLRTPTSSALATGIGLNTLRELGCAPSQPAVRQAVDYLVATIEQDAQVWRVAPHDTNAFAHAPWWHDEAGSLARTFDDFLIIPRAQIVGLLWHVSAQGPEMVPGGWIEDLTERTVSGIESIAALGTGGGDDLVYALSLMETEDLPDHFRRRLARKLRDVVPSVVSRDPQEWGSYCITPLKVAPSPNSFAADLIRDDLQAYLDYQINRQTPEGTWDPVWTWGDSYPEAWPQARQECRGHLTLETLTSLRAFGRIEE